MDRIDPEQLTALLRGARGGGRGGGGGGGVLLEFKAGWVNVQGGRATPDPARGAVKVSVEQQAGGRCRIELGWFVRPEMREDASRKISVGKGEATWAIVEKARASRVYALEVAARGQKHLFWMQEPEAKRDEEVAERLSSILATGRLPAGAGAPEGAAAAAQAGAAHPDVARLEQALRESMSQGGGGMGDGPPLVTVPGSAPSSQGGQPDMGPLAADGAGGGGGGGGGQAELLRALLAAQQRARAVEPTLVDVLLPSRVVPVVDADDSLPERLYPHLPEGQRNPEALRQQLRSPQLRQTLLRLTAALRGDQYASVVASLGLQPSAEAGTVGLVDAIQRRADEQRRQAGGNSGGGDEPADGAGGDDSGDAAGGGAAPSGQ